MSGLCGGSCLKGQVSETTLGRKNILRTKREPRAGWKFLFRQRVAFASDVKGLTYLGVKKEEKGYHTGDVN